ncbi:MAG: hypothetical protein HY549_03960 [Elusimicrobia bacterium]|nr:hypothetical protein [Elusimicrobiota bacterium]
MSSKYEKNIALQPGLIRAILAAEPPSWMEALRSRPIHWVGVGSNYHAARIADCLWRRHVSPRSWAVHSFDFARLPQPIGPGDVAALLSHRGTKSFTVEAAALAAKAGAVTVALTGQASPWRDHLAHRLETCESEDSGVFTKSLTTTLAWIARWIGGERLLAGMDKACAGLEAGPPFPEGQDWVILGDLEREWVARELALKIQESSYHPARAFGLEEFLHGPRVSVDGRSVVIALSGEGEPRWQAVRDYLKTVGAVLCEVEDGPWRGEAAWLGQLFWGQRLALELCRRAGVDPDAMRTQDPRYKKAREALRL